MEPKSSAMMNDLTWKGSISGTGPIYIADGASTDPLWYHHPKTLTFQGAAVKPSGTIGDIGNPTGGLLFTGNVAFAKDGSQNSSLHIGVRSATDHDQMVMDTCWILDNTPNGWGGYDEGGMLTGLENANLVLNVTPGVDMKGAVLTVLINRWGIQTEQTSAGDWVTSGTDFSASAGFANAPNVGGLGNFKDAKWKALVHYNLNEIVVDSFAAAAIPGDANHSGLVDQDDYKVWYDNYGTGTTWEQGNFKGSGVTDQDDYKTWYDNYGVGTAGGAVPEPATMALLAMGGLAMLRRNKK